MFTTSFKMVVKCFWNIYKANIYSTYTVIHLKTFLIQTFIKHFVNICRLNICYINVYLLLLAYSKHGLSQDIPSNIWNINGLKITLKCFINVCIHNSFEGNIFKKTKNSKTFLHHTFLFYMFSIFCLHLITWFPKM